MTVLIGGAVTGGVLVILAAIRIGRVASWRALGQVAVATGSLKACVEFVRYCERF